MDARGTLQADVAARPRARWGPRILAWLLLAACGVLLVTALLVGERISTYGDLRAAVRAGDVDTVTVAGGTGHPYRGHQTVEVRWRSGLFRHVAEVIEAHPRSAGVREGRTAGLPVVADSVADDLARLDPGVEVHREHLTMLRSGEVLGWRLPAWAGPAAFLLWIATFLLLIAGPDPWRANRWAWFWFLLLASPVGLVAFLVLGGAAGFLPPADPSRRMRGGWGFLLALVVGLATSSVRVSFGV